MKVARSSVFLLVPIPIERAARTKVESGFCTGSNGSVPQDQKYDERRRWRVRNRNDYETEALPHHLFWTWFVDNPRPRFKSL